MDKFPDTVEDFVEHLSFLGRMSTELPALDKEYNIVNKLFTIANDFSVFIHPEDMALYKTLSPSFQHLKVCLLLYIIPPVLVVSRYSFISHLEL